MSILGDVAIENQIVRDIHAHETLVSWRNDDQNVLFQEWLFEEGFIMFEKYIEEMNE